MIAIARDGGNFIPMYILLKIITALDENYHKQGRIQDSPGAGGGGGSILLGGGSVTYDFDKNFHKKRLKSKSVNDKLGASSFIFDKHMYFKTSHWSFN